MLFSEEFGGPRVKEEGRVVCFGHPSKELAEVDVELMQPTPEFRRPNLGLKEKSALSRNS
jgi:hypothetical protein